MHWELAAVCYRRVSRDGPIIKGAKGVCKHPALQVLRDNSSAFRECLSRMGMTPVDIGKIDAADAPDPDDDFFRLSR
jgi:phage terminase small subunit